jgi:hypothetical protein
MESELITAEPETATPELLPRLSPLLAPDVMRWINHQFLRPPESDHPVFATRRPRSS